MWGFRARNKMGSPLLVGGGLVGFCRLLLVVAQCTSVLRTFSMTDRLPFVVCSEGLQILSIKPPVHPWAFGSTLLCLASTP